MEGVGLFNSFKLVFLGFTFLGYLDWAMAIPFIHPFFSFFIFFYRKKLKIKSI